MNYIGKTMSTGLESVELYYSGYSINSEKVLMCLFEKGVSFTGHYIDLFKFEQTDPEYLAVNPLGLVPTLIVDGVPVPESTIINEFIEDALPANPLRPEDPLLRARMRELVQRFQESFYPQMAMLSQVHFVADQLKRRWSAAELEQLVARKPLQERVEKQQRALKDGLRESDIAAADKTVNQMLDKMEALLSGGEEWLLGTFSLADIAAVPNVHRFYQLGIEEAVERRPAVRQWYHRISQRPSFGRTYEFANQSFD